MPHSVRLVMDDRIKQKGEEREVKSQMRRMAEEEIYAQIQMEQRNLFSGYDLESKIRGVLESLTDDEKAEVFS